MASYLAIILLYITHHLRPGVSKYNYSQTNIMPIHTQYIMQNTVYHVYSQHMLSLRQIVHNKQLLGILWQAYVDTPEIVWSAWSSNIYLVISQGFQHHWIIMDTKQQVSPIIIAWSGAALFAIHIIYITIWQVNILNFNQTIISIMCSMMYNNYKIDAKHTSNQNLKGDRSTSIIMAFLSSGCQFTSENCKREMYNVV